VATEDEATFGLIPIVSRGWARKGSKPVAVINHAYEYTNIFGARSKCAFVFMFSSKKNQKAFLKFCNELLKRWHKVFLIVDGARAHKGANIEKFLKNHKKTFKIGYFPKYTPELNPTEQCWKIGRKGIANRLLMNVPAMKYHLRKTFNDKKSLPKMFHYLVN